jgi:uncharacterized protein
MQSEPINIPSEEECKRIISEMGMLDHIVAHSRQVCRVSLLLTDYLGFIGLNRELIRAAALLHDITKTRSFQTNEDHAETGARLLMDLGYPEVAGIVCQHVRLTGYSFASATPTDAEIVNYSDKRVLHDKVVPLSDRMGYILEKYGNTQERKSNIRILWEKTQQLEERLFTGLPFSPGDVSGLLSVEGSPRDCQGQPQSL